MAECIDDAACIDDAGYKEAAEKQAKATRVMGYSEIAVMAALALWQRNTSRDIAKMQQEIADEQMRLAEKLHDHAKRFWQEEIDLLNDAYGEERAATDYAGLPTGWKGLVTDSMNAGRREWMKLAGQFCFDPDLCEDARWQRFAKTAEADMLSFGARQAEGRAQKLRDRRYQRRYEVLKIGRDQLGYVEGFQNIAMSVAERSSGVLFGTINSAAQAVGYWMQYRQPNPYQHAPAAAQGGVPMRGPVTPERVDIVRGEIASPNIEISIPGIANVAQQMTGKAGGLTGEGFEGGAAEQLNRIRRREEIQMQQDAKRYQNVREGGGF